MFCDQCGAALVAGQLRCTRCGKEIVGYVRPNRVQEHVRLLGILWMAASALNVVGGLVLVVIANTLFNERLGQVPGSAAHCLTFRWARRLGSTLSGSCFPRSRMMSIERWRRQHRQVIFASHCVSNCEFSAGGG